MPQGESPQGWQAKLSKRRRQVLDDSEAAGMLPEEIRAMVKGDMALEAAK